MMKIVKFSCYFLLLLGFIVLIGVMSLRLFIDPNQMKSTLIAEVKNRTGVEIVIPGDLSWNFYPTFSLKTNSLAISQAKAAPILWVEDAKFSTELRYFWKSKHKVRGILQVGQVSINNLKIQDVIADIYWKDNVFNLLIKQMHLYEGKGQGQLRAYNFNNDMELAFQLTLDQIDVARLFEGLHSKFTFAGFGSLDLNGQTKGDDKDSLIQNLNASGSFKIIKGAMNGADLNYLLQLAQSFLQQRSVEVINSKITSFDFLSGNFTIEKANITIPNLFLSGDVFACKGNGEIQVAENKLNFDLSVATKESQKNIVIPLIVKGSLNHPKIKVDKTALTNLGITTEVVEEKKIEPLSQLPEESVHYIENLLTKIKV